MANSSHGPRVHQPGLGHLSVRPEGEPTEVLFLFERQDERMGRAFGVSVVTHVAVLLLGLLILRLAPEPVRLAVLPDRLPSEIVWLTAPGPGGGGGGGGNETPEPPRQAELPGQEQLTVPVVQPATPTIDEAKAPEPEPEPVLNIPAKTMAAGTLVLPGVLESTSASSVLSQGTGTGGGAGSGTGTGIGPGQGSGLGPGFGGGTGGGAYRPGNGVELPRVLREVKPQYTADAMRAKVQGTVLLECIVLADGTVGSVQVRKSLDSTFGLDQEAVKAARQWRFSPGTRFGEPVPVIISIELTFTLR